MILADGTITATDRPAFPWGTVHTDTRNNLKLWTVDRPVPLNYEIPMAWHHLIAWRYLRDGWSALATSNRWDAIAAWVDIWNLDIDTKVLVTSMKGNALGSPNNGSMYDKLCWCELNLVEGPKESNRTDDPGSEALDPFEGRTMSSKVRNRSQILKSIFTVIKTWPATKNNVSASDEKLLVQDFKKLLPYKRSPISMFDPKLWTMEDEGKIDKFGLASRHATWRKAA